MADGDDLREKIGVNIEEAKKEIAAAKLKSKEGSEEAKKNAYEHWENAKKAKSQLERDLEIRAAAAFFGLAMLPKDLSDLLEWSHFKRKEKEYEKAGKLEEMGERYSQGAPHRSAAFRKEFNLLAAECFAKAGLDHLKKGKVADAERCLKRACSLMEMEGKADEAAYLHILFRKTGT